MKPLKLIVMKVKTFFKKNYLMIALVLGLVLIASIVYITNGRNSQNSLEKSALEQGTVVEESPEQYLVEDLGGSVTAEALTSFQDDTARMPANPTGVTARCQSTGTSIQSGVATSCKDPVFSWTAVSGATNYLVYWYKDSDPAPKRYLSGSTMAYSYAHPPILVQLNQFKPMAYDLVSGTTYSLRVQTEVAANGVSKTGGTVVDSINGIIEEAGVAFTYVYR